MTEHGIIISVQRTKLITSTGPQPDRGKFVIVKKIMEKVNSFTYLGKLISDEKEADIDNSLNNYLKITSSLKNMFRPQKTLKKTIVKLHITLSLPALLYDSETRNFKARVARKITAEGIKYTLKTTG